MKPHVPSQVFKWLIAFALGISLMELAFLLGFGAGLSVGRWMAPANLHAAMKAILPIEAAKPQPSATPRSGIFSTTDIATVESSADNEANLPPEQPKEFQVFWEAWQLLQQDFYGPLPSNQEMTYGAIRGVLELLNDENTTFLDPRSAEFFSTDLTGVFEGIGARVDLAPGGGVLIVEPFEGQPAYEAGIQRGDIIVEVDGQDVTNMPLGEAIQLIRGPKGTKVRLLVKRSNAPKLIEIEVVRDRIEIPIIESKMLDGGIAYLKLGEFNGRSPELIRRALRELLRQKPKGLILDLRGNPGGFLDAAVEIGSQFVGKGNILIERFKDGKTKEYQARPGGLATEIPLAVLVNEGSASASEIVAGAIQDVGRGPLIGVTTFGKGSVQVPHRLSDGSILRVTTARWFTPKGRGIDGIGLEPDIVVERTLEDRAAGRDPQLNRAVEYLLTGK